VPMWIISPWAVQVCITTMEFASVLRFNEETFGLPSRGESDAIGMNMQSVQLLATPLAAVVLNPATFPAVR